jgi:class I fructose-bisphosphate aldolase
VTERPTFQEAGLGATGLIFGRNVWQRERDESLKLVARLREVLEVHPRPA